MKYQYHPDQDYLTLIEFPVSLDRLDTGIITILLLPNFAKNKLVASR